MKLTDDEIIDLYKELDAYIDEYLEEKQVIMGSYMDVWKEEVTRLNEFYDLEENW